MRYFCQVILIGLMSFAAVGQTAASRSPQFKSDKCTMFPDGNYAECCIAHDQDYFVGGTAKERRASDKRLYRCVRNMKGWQNEVAAPIMFLGVRVFGVSWLPTRFRWGFGKKRG